MRELIRPAMFLAARFGPGLTAIVWILSQWYDVEFLLHGMKHKVIVARTGIVLSNGWDDGWRV